jgi:hypothetical protein
MRTTIIVIVGVGRKESLEEKKNSTRNIHEK